MFATKLFALLMGVLTYLVLSALWFVRAAPWLFTEGSEASLFIFVVGMAVWLIFTACLFIHLIQKARPA